MSTDKVLAEELLSRGADASLKATKRDIQGGAQLTTKELAVAIGFKHLQVFEKLDSEKEKEKKPKNHNLGEADIASSGTPQGTKSIEDVKVRVTGQDTVISEGSMMDKFSTFLNTFIPDFDKKHLKFPLSFIYDKTRIHEVDGPTDVGQNQVHETQIGAHPAKDWARHVQAMKGEELLDKALHQAFSKRTSMMWNGFEQDTLFKIAKDCIKYDLQTARANQKSLLDVPLLPGEKALQELFGVNMDQLENEVCDFVKEIFSEKQEMTEEDLATAIDEKCMNPKKTAKKKDIRPVFELLTQVEQTYYKQNLKKHIKKAFDKDNKKGKKDASKKIKTVEPAELGHYLTRYFMNLLAKQAEFDHLLVDKISSTFIQVEVKTYPQQGQI